MWDLNTLKYMNGTPEYKRKIDRMVKIIKVKEWFKKLSKSKFFWFCVVYYIVMFIVWLTLGEN